MFGTYLVTYSGIALAEIVQVSSVKCYGNVHCYFVNVHGNL